MQHTYMYVCLPSSCLIPPAPQTHHHRPQHRPPSTCPHSPHTHPPRKHTTPTNTYFPPPVSSPPPRPANTPPPTQAAIELPATNQGRAAYHLLTQRLPHTRPLHPVQDAEEIKRSYDKVGRWGNRSVNPVGRWVRGGGGVCVGVCAYGGAMAGSSDAFVVVSFSSSSIIKNHKSKNNSWPGSSTLTTKEPAAAAARGGGGGGRERGEMWSKLDGAG